MWVWMCGKEGGYCLLPSAHIKMDLKGIGWEGVDLVDVTLGTGHLLAFVNMVQNLQVPRVQGISYCRTHIPGIVPLTVLVWIYFKFYKF